VRAPSLHEQHDLIILDLDGVVYVGAQPIAGAVEAVNALYHTGQHIAYATNNASRQPLDVCRQLAAWGIPAQTGEVVTSAQVAAEYLAQQLEPGSRVLVVGSAALRDEVDRVGLRPVEAVAPATAAAAAGGRPNGVGAAGEPVLAVVQGYGPDVGWSQLAEACLAVRGGAIWVATNADRTLPSPRGLLPGNGALVAALVTALDREPDAVIGKPAPYLFRQAAQRTGAGRPLVVGDRLDTDIEAAGRAGMASALVLTGVATATDLLVAPVHQRPTYVLEHLGQLLASPPPPALAVPTSSPPAGEGLRPVPNPADLAKTDPSVAGWQARMGSTGWELHGRGTTLDALATLCAAVWSHPDPVGRPPVVIPGSAPAAAALSALGLAT
jgi:HAD superfamily hydrolase (TIGR01450 family)